MTQIEPGQIGGFDRSLAARAAVYTENLNSGVVVVKAAKDGV
ncbi:hypothetical protein SAMN05444159_1898 [Bradyrhizobium lablabi]|uniref:Uncharacterized protein n=1 Tax=Bradyrhizobium lablabi TaxID=722472 RepID=A0A1M6N8D9_9BRAD|nr:hypothetical protein [Bradyrhizobium lablabi]SHJ91941.1 hypothetical protein SAMN05444159_1898 [Bradyrhizobium lablabi]